MGGTALAGTTLPPQVCQTSVHQVGDSNLTKNKRQLKICALNVCGLTSKLSNGVFDKYFCKFDIFCVTESKLAKGKTIENYKAFNLKKSKKYPKPGVHGLQVYIKKDVARNCYQIENNDFLCEPVLWIKISNDFILGTLYTPNQNSDYYCSDFFEDLALDICTIRKDYDLPLMLIGDFNSRTGTLNDIMLNETPDDVLDINNFLYPNILNTLHYLDIPKNRSNMDPTINNNGHGLIELCLCHELVILNGRLGNDKNIGNTTFDNKSTIDYALCTPDLLEKITNFSVAPFNPMFSDKHNPICVTLDMAQNLPIVQNLSTDYVNNDQTSNEPKIKFEWDKSKMEDYQNSFDRNKLQIISNKLSTVNISDITDDTIQEIADDFKNMIIESAKATGMCKQIPIHKSTKKQKQNKPWFNTNCKESVKNYKKVKKSISKLNNIERKKELKKCSQKHMKLIRKEKRKYDKEQNKKLKLLKSTNPGKYWQIINKGKKSTKVGNIPPSAVYDHFRLLNKLKDANPNNSQNTTETLNENPNEEVNKHITEDEVRIHISNLRIISARG